ncbi:MAG: DEAD/DEAH box helicase [Crocinitomicaceae bacterium]|nr:DEAD/DEAH box helicase [Crocinitomicaceae bacterium]
MTFQEFNLNKFLLNALTENGFAEPTVIQEKVYPVMLSGKDLIGIAQTGTGKTLAYLLPALQQWKFSKDRDPQILILVPTRELVVQVVSEIEKLTEYMNVTTVGVYGGTNINTQAAEVEQGLDIVVGTPGRLLDLAYRGSLRFKSIKKIIIDEVDEMLNLGFRPQIRNVLDLIPEKVQHAMFSATLDEEIEAITHEFFKSPEKVEAAPPGTPVEKISQSLFQVKNFNTKINLLKDILVNPDAYDFGLNLDDEGMEAKILVFTSSKKFADKVFEELEGDFDEILGVMHSNKSQNYRLNTIAGFQEGEIKILIATDLISRGLDISEVSHVINFDMPEVAENYIHRIGRTGRIDKKGIAISFATEQEQEQLNRVESLMSMKIPKLDFPEHVPVSNTLIFEEEPKIHMKPVEVKLENIEERGPAFHEKKEKNKKVNKKVTKAEKMKKKYKKPKKRGQKPRGKKK